MQGEVSYREPENLSSSASDLEAGTGGTTYIATPGGRAVKKAMLFTSILLFIVACVLLVQLGNDRPPLRYGSDSPVAPHELNDDGTPDQPKPGPLKTGSILSNAPRDEPSEYKDENVDNNEEIADESEHVMSFVTRTMSPEPMETTTLPDSNLLIANGSSLLSSDNMGQDDMNSVNETDILLVPHPNASVSSSDSVINYEMNQGMQLTTMFWKTNLTTISSMNSTPINPMTNNILMEESTVPNSQDLTLYHKVNNNTFMVNKFPSIIYQLLPEKYFSLPSTMDGLMIDSSIIRKSKRSIITSNENSRQLSQFPETATAMFVTVTTPSTLKESTTDSENISKLTGITTIAASSIPLSSTEFPNSIIRLITPPTKDTYKISTLQSTILEKLTTTTNNIRQDESTESGQIHTWFENLNNTVEVTTVNKNEIDHLLKLFSKFTTVEPFTDATTTTLQTSVGPRQVSEESTFSINTNGVTLIEHTASSHPSTMHLESITALPSTDTTILLSETSTQNRDMITSAESSTASFHTDSSTTTEEGDTSTSRQIIEEELSENEKALTFSEDSTLSVSTLPFSTETNAFSDPTMLKENGIMSTDVESYTLSPNTIQSTAEGTGDISTIWSTTLDFETVKTTQEEFTEIRRMSTLPESFTVTMDETRGETSGLYFTIPARPKIISEGSLKSSKISTQSPIPIYSTEITSEKYSKTNEQSTFLQKSTTEMSSTDASTGEFAFNLLDDSSTTTEDSIQITSEAQEISTLGSATTISSVDTTGANQEKFITNTKVTIPPQSFAIPSNEVSTLLSINVAGKEEVTVVMESETTWESTLFQKTTTPMSFTDVIQVSEETSAIPLQSGNSITTIPYWDTTQYMTDRVPSSTLTESNTVTVELNSRPAAVTKMMLEGSGEFTENEGSTSGLPTDTTSLMITMSPLYPETTTTEENPASNNSTSSPWLTVTSPMSTTLYNYSTSSELSSHIPTDFGIIQTWSSQSLTAIMLANDTQISTNNSVSTTPSVRTNTFSTSTMLRTHFPPFKATNTITSKPISSNSYRTPLVHWLPTLTSGNTLKPPTTLQGRNYGSSELKNSSQLPTTSTEVTLDMKTQTKKKKTTTPIYAPDPQPSPTKYLSGSTTTRQYYFGYTFPLPRRPSSRQPKSQRPKNYYEYYLQRGHFPLCAAVLAFFRSITESYSK